MPYQMNVDDIELARIVPPPMSNERNYLFRMPNQRRMLRKKFNWSRLCYVLIYWCSILAAALTMAIQSVPSEICIATVAFAVAVVVGSIMFANKIVQKCPNVAKNWWIVVI